MLLAQCKKQDLTTAKEINTAIKQWLQEIGWEHDHTIIQTSTFKRAISVLGKEQGIYFLVFWSVYPCSNALDHTLFKFKNLEVDQDLFVQILQAIDWQIKERKQLLEIRDYGDRVFIPDWKHSKTWLNARCFEDNPNPIIKEKVARGTLRDAIRRIEQGVSR